MIVFLTAFWQCGLFYGIFMGLWFSYLYGWEDGLTGGAFGGFAFGLWMGLIVYWRSRKFTQNRPLHSGEKLIHEGTASRHRKGGWIYLTDSRLIFVPQKLGIKASELEFPLSEIASAEQGRRLGVIPNKLILNLRNGQTEEFVVQNTKDWVRRINRASDLVLEAPRDLKYL